MRRIIRHFAVETFSLYVASVLATGFYFESGIETLLLTGVGLTVASFLAKPVINILLLPLNLVTFGLFKWISGSIVLYIVTLIIPGFKITGFLFEGLISKWVDLPPIDLGPGPLSYIAYSFVLSLITTVIYKLIK